MKTKLSLLAICFTIITQANATTWYVNASASGTNNGTSWTNAYTTLQNALTAASSGDEIWVAGGTYTATSGFSFVMKTGVKVYGGFASGMALVTDRITGANTSTLQGNTKSVVSCDATITSTTTLDGFTITGGTGAGTTGIASGGGISLVDASPTLNNLIVTANSAANGAGINMSGASAPVITNATISSNTASVAGGGIAVAGTSAATLTRVIILSNSAAGTGTPPVANTTDGGGGMFVTGTGNQTLTNVVFQSNSATSSQGGGLALIHASAATGNLNLTNTVFYNNTAAYGGGIYTLRGNLNAKNSVFTANNSTVNSPYGAGAISMNTTGTSVTTILNCTFYNNLSGGASANPDLRYLNGKSSNLITNTVFYTNGETATSTLIGLNSTTSPTLTNSYLPFYNGFTPSATNKVGASNATALQNPFYGSSTMTLSDMKGPDGLWMTSDDGLHLSGSSAAGTLAANAGNNTGVTAKDITNLNPRIQNTTVDMGAYEGVWRLFPLPVKLISFNGVLQNSLAQLQWKTSTEDNFNHFELERSTDGQTYTTVASITAKGNESSYNYSIAQIATKAYYRLKIVDNDSKYVFSNILSLAQQSAATTLQLYPNPATSYITITAGEDAVVKIYDAAGRIAKTETVKKGTNTVYINSLQKGIYICDVNGSKAQFVKQ